MKRFNTRGTCIPERNYMVDTSEKLDKIIEMINYGEYFIINRPRQYGKTTTLFLLEEKLKALNYYIFSISFEGIGDKIFNDEGEFCKVFLELLSEVSPTQELSSFIAKMIPSCDNLKDLSSSIKALIAHSDRKVLLFIDEVDKNSNNQLFVSFLGVLRNKYLDALKNKDKTFHSVILAGLHDIKNIKLKIGPESETKFNSPWNIAAKFDIDMSFSPKEISTMLAEYVNATGKQMDVEAMSEKLHFYTSGYPFIVSRLCEIIDIEIKPAGNWTLEILDTAFKRILVEKNACFETLTKNLENNNELYAFVSDIVVTGAEKSFNLYNPIIDFGIEYGIFKSHGDKLAIHNRIFNQIIYNYMTSKIESSTMSSYNFRNNFLKDGSLDMELVLHKFQQFMKETYSDKNIPFYEKDGKLLLLAFIKPIINGQGFMFVETQISQEQRLDAVITYQNKKFVIETKIWHGQKYHQDGLLQLAGYLDSQSIDKGYLVVFDFRKDKETTWTEDVQTVDGKEIHMVKIK